MPATAAKPVEAVAQASSIKRVLFTSAIENHEPVDAVDSLTTGSEVVYFFTEVLGMTGETLTHRWTHGGIVRAEVVIEVRSQRWRAVSSKKMLPGWTGDWTAEVVDASGKVLAKKTFRYVSPN